MSTSEVNGASLAPSRSGHDDLALLLELVRAGAREPMLLAEGYTPTECAMIRARVVAEQAAESGRSARRHQG
jgi:hypothetical protein